MRTAALLVREHANKAFDLLLGPDAGIQAALEEFKALRGAGKTHERFAEVHLYLSDEGLKKIKFQPPESASESETVGGSPTEEAAAKAKADQEAADKAAAEKAAAEKAAAEKAAAEKAAAEKAAAEKAAAEKAAAEKAAAEKAAADKKAKAEADKKAKADAKIKAAAAAAK